MAENLTKITFTVTKEIEETLTRLKKEIFYDQNRSEMIRNIIIAGVRSLEKDSAQK